MSARSSVSGFLSGAAVAMSFPILLKQHLLEARSIRVALFRIYSNNPADAFYSNACAVLSRLDQSTGHLHYLESKYGLLEMVAPHGTLQPIRKLLSYSGGVRKNRGLPLSLATSDPGAVRDPGNYCYGVLMRTLASLWPERHWLGYSCRVEYNDETLGDILEAVLGAAWLCRHGYVACGIEEINILNQYTLAIEQCTIDAERVIHLTTIMGIWTDSKSLANLLV